LPYFVAHESTHDDGRIVRDPREYRLYALQCAEMASRAQTPQLKASFLELGAKWRRLAESFEAAQAWLAQDQDDPLMERCPRQQMAATFH
jgi:hypothetical protein